MSRTNINYADAAAEIVADVSHALTRALVPHRPMTLDDRRRNLMSLAQIIISEDCWTVEKVVTPSLRPLVRYYALTADPVPAFGRLLRAVKAGMPDEIDKAMVRLLDIEVAA